MSHYYSEQQESTSLEQEVRFSVLGEDFTCTTDGGVFAKDGLDRGTRELIERVEIQPGSRVLDLGAGWGAIGVALGRHWGLEVVAVERNARAAALCARNLARWEVRGQTLQGDGFAPVAEQTFDAILLNPPIRAGKKVYYPWLAAARSHLRPGGTLWVVVRTNQGARSLRRELETHYDEVKEVSITSGYRVYRAS